MINAGEVRDTLVLLVPGFVALKIFALFGLNIRRTQFEWTVWSVVVSAIIAAILAPANVPEDVRLWPALGIAILTGASLTKAWNLGATPELRSLVQPRAWDVVLDPKDAHWVMVTLVNGEEIVGWPRLSAVSVDTDDLDVYLERCELVAADGTRQRFESSKGILIARSQISRMQVLEPGPPVQPTTSDAG